MCPVSVTQFPLQPKVPLRTRYGQALASLCELSKEKVWKVGNRTLLLELTLTLSEWKRPLPVVIPFPPTPYCLSSGSSDAAPKQIAAHVVARERWRAETSVRQKHAAMVAWMKRDRGATARELVELTGWRKTTVVAFVRSLTRKGREVAWEENAAGEPWFRIVE
jgi:hypothetical protein